MAEEKGAALDTPVTQNSVLAYLEWTISHPKRLVLAALKGEVRPRGMIATLDTAGARPFAKLVFLERLVSTFSEDSVVALANLVRKREEEKDRDHGSACRSEVIEARRRVVRSGG